eukprot:5139655-Prymnesium_polylepis.1
MLDLTPSLQYTVIAALSPSIVVRPARARWHTGDCQTEVIKCALAGRRALRARVVQWSSRSASDRKIAGSSLRAAVSESVFGARHGAV